MQREATQSSSSGTSLGQFWQYRTLPKLKAANRAVEVMQKQNMNLVMLIGILVMGAGAIERGF